MVGMPIGVGIFCDRGATGTLQTERSAQEAGTVKRRTAPERGVCVCVQLQADRPRQWSECQVDWSPSLQVFQWVMRTGRCQTQACWRQEQQDFPFRLGSRRTKMGVCHLTNKNT